MEKECIVCNKIFKKSDTTSLKKWSTQRFCSLSCVAKKSQNGKKTRFKVGHKFEVHPRTGKEPWNKGISVRLNPSHEFKKGENLGEKHRLWKNEDANIKTKHSWVKRHKGKPQSCSKCGVSVTEKTIDWANIDHKYSRNLEDYIALCRSCHRKHDIENNGYNLNNFIR